MSPTQQYRALVSQLAANAPLPDGFTHVQQLQPLSNAQRALLLRVNPDVLNDWDVTAEGLADVFDGHVLPGMFLAATLEPLLRRWLLLDVIAECEAERERLEAQRYDEPDMASLFV
jgi:hypothetical protein